MERKRTELERGLRRLELDLTARPVGGFEVYHLAVHQSLASVLLRLGQFERWGFFDAACPDAQAVAGRGRM